MQRGNMAASAEDCCVRIWDLARKTCDPGCLISGLYCLISDLDCLLPGLVCLISKSQPVTNTRPTQRGNIVASAEDCCVRIWNLAWKTCSPDCRISGLCCLIFGFDCLTSGLDCLISKSQLITNTDGPHREGIWWLPLRTAACGFGTWRGRRAVLGVCK